MTTPRPAKRKYEYAPNYAVKPGETLREVIENLGMTQKALATRTGLTEQTIVRILNGDQPITFDTANKLELVTGVPARLWNNLEMQYRERLSKISQREVLESDLAWLRGIPTRELVSRGMLPDVRDEEPLVQETLRFYGVSSVDAWQKVWNAPKVAARRSDCFETAPGAASAWIRIGELQAQQIECSPYDEQKFEAAVASIRKLTTQQPAAFLPEMRRLCAAAGVALALVPEIKKVPWNGATKWLSPQKAMILLSLRGRKEDVFWFSFFHEASHVLHDKKQHLYIADDKSTAPEEKKADQFAADTLIPASYNQRIANCSTEEQIQTLARKLGISAGIVAGRFRHLTGKWTHFQGLTRTFNWTDEKRKAS